MINEPSYNQNTFRNCNFAKSALMICVILGHSLAFWSDGWFSAIEPVYSCVWLGWLANWFGSFHIYAFTLISGFIYYYLKCERSHYDDAKVFITKKARRLIVPYFFMAIIWVAPISCFFYHYSLLDVFYYYVLGTSPGQLWFLLMLFEVFIIFNLSFKFFSKHRILSLTLIIILHIIGFVGLMISFKNYFQIFTSFYYLIFFYLGYKIREYYTIFFRKEGISLNNKSFLFSLSLINVIGYMAYVWLSSFEGSMYYSFFKRLIFEFLNFEGAVTSFALLMKIGNKIGDVNSKLVNMFNDNNFVMYLFHQQLIYFSIFWLNGVVVPEVNAFINFVFSFTTSLVISIVLHKVKFVRILLGEGR